MAKRRLWVVEALNHARCARWFTRSGWAFTARVDAREKRRNLVLVTGYKARVVPYVPGRSR